MINETITISAYELQATYDTLYETLEWLEQYVEKAGYYPNWQSKKQLPNTITRTDIDTIGPKRMKSIFSTSLFALRNLTRNKPDFLLEGLEKEFCSWLDGSGINSGNCPSELAQCLVNISQVLKGKGEEFVKARRKEVDENIAKMSKEERRAKFNEAVTAYQEPLENEEEKAKSLEGQTYRDVNNESRFVGSADKGKKNFELIEKEHELKKREEELKYLNQGDDMETDEVQTQRDNRPQGGRGSGGWGSSSYLYSSFTIISLIGLMFTR